MVHIKKNLGKSYKEILNLALLFKVMTGALPHSQKNLHNYFMAA